MAEKKTETLFVTLLEAENVMRLRSFSAAIPISGALVIEGKNEAGKSSVLRLSDLLLAGARKGEDPIHGNEEEGRVSGKIGPYTITRVFKRGGSPTLSIREDGNKAKLKAPQTLLAEFIDFLSVDPGRFAAMEPDKQLEVISRLVGFDSKPYDEKRQKAYLERTELNRDRDRVAHELAGCGPAVKAPAAEVSVKDLMAELEKRRIHNADGERIESQIAIVQDEVERGEKRFAELEAELARVHGTIAKAQEQETQLLAALAEFTPENEAEIKAQIASADAINAAVRSNARRVKLEAELKAHSLQSAALTATLEEIDAAKAAARKAAAAKLAIPGLDITDSGIIYNGKPFGQAGRSATGRISAAVAIASAADKPVKLLTIDEAQQYDEENLRAIVAQANAAGFQVMVARNGKSNEPGVITIEDGAIAAR